MATLTPTQIIDSVLNKLGPNGEHWVKRKFKDENGNMCLMGAVRATMGLQNYICMYKNNVIADIVIAIANILTAEYGAYKYPSQQWFEALQSIQDWNDAPKRTFTEIRTVLEKARANL